MKVACAILAGGNRENLIGGAINSCRGHVDHYIIVDTGPSAEEAISLARQMLRMDCTVVTYPGEFDCATARNFAIDSAIKRGFDWVLHLDTDERLIAQDGLVRRMLSEVDTETVLIEGADGNYKKTKFFHKSHSGRWAGIVHEGYCTSTRRTFAKGITFSEIPKGDEETLARNHWIERKTREAMALEPDQARWHFYLADALQSLGHFDDAVDEYMVAANLSRWSEEINWSIGCASRLRAYQERFEDAARLCIEAGAPTPELAWHAAYCLHKLERHDEAIQMALRAAELSESQNIDERLGFVHRFAWYEGPHDVLRWCYRALGKDELEAQALQRVNERQQQRLKAA